eukprot:GDKJ01037047.1.p1 GENE.GDKJ01037047.1~~GDKJ01037047.1.p1  ORF type:complete len:813 (+),score=168.75 GDKJ01037047.1:39-2477(+)
MYEGPWIKAPVSKHDEYRLSLNYSHVRIRWLRLSILIGFGMIMYGLLVSCYSTLHLQAFDASFSPSLKAVITPLLIACATSFSCSILAACFAVIVSFRARTLSVWKQFLNNLEGIGFSMCCFVTTYQIYCQLPLTDTSIFSFSCLRWFQFSLALTIIQFILLNPEIQWQSVSDSALSLTVSVCLLTATIIYELSAKQVLEFNAYFIFAPILIILLFGVMASASDFCNIFRDTARRNSTGSRSNSSSKLPSPQTSKLSNPMTREVIDSVVGTSANDGSVVLLSPGTHPEDLARRSKLTIMMNKSTSLFHGTSKKNFSSASLKTRSLTETEEASNNNYKPSSSLDNPPVASSPEPSPRLESNHVVSLSVGKWAHQGWYYPSLYSVAADSTPMSLALANNSEYGSVVHQNQSRPSKHTTSNSMKNNSMLSPRARTSRISSRLSPVDGDTAAEEEVHLPGGDSVNPLYPTRQDAEYCDANASLPVWAEAEEEEEEHDESKCDPEAPCSKSTERDEDDDLLEMAGWKKLDNIHAVEFHAMKDVHLPSKNNFRKNRDIDLCRVNALLMSQPTCAMDGSYSIMGGLWHFSKVVGYICLILFVCMLADAGERAGHDAFLPLLVEKETKRDFINSILSENQLLVMTGVTDKNAKQSTLKDMLVGTGDLAVDAAVNFKKTITSITGLQPLQEEVDGTPSEDKMEEKEAVIDNTPPSPTLTPLVNPHQQGFEKREDERTAQKEKKKSEIDQAVAKPWFARGEYEESRASSSLSAPPGESLPVSIEGARYIFLLGWLGVIFLSGGVLWTMGRWLESQIFDCMVA